MMFYLFQHPLVKWFIALIGSLLLHFLFGYYYFFKADIPVSELTSSAVIVEFSDPPQSIFMPVELPVGPPQQISTESLPEPEQENANEPEISSDLAVEEQTPLDVKPEIVVQQKPKKMIKPKDNLKKNESKKPSKEKVKKKKEDPQNTKIVKKPQLNKEKNKNTHLDKISVAGSNVATAPPTGTSDRIAAEFNSNSQGRSLEMNWKGLVKLHLERNLRYPEQALRKRWKGIANIKLILDSQGNVLKASLVTSSGKESLDREAIENAKRSSPLPKPPAHLTGQTTISIDVPVSFDYEKYRK